MLQAFLRGVDAGERLRFRAADGDVRACEHLAQGAGEHRVVLQVLQGLFQRRGKATNPTFVLVVVAQIGSGEVVVDH